MPGSGVYVYRDNRSPWFRRVRAPDKGEEPRVRWLEFGDSSLDFELLAFIVDIENGANTRSDLHFAIFKALKDAGIEIPFPQRDLHIKSDMTPVAK